MTTDNSSPALQLIAGIIIVMMLLSVLSAVLVSGTEALSLTELAEPASERQAVDISSLILPTFLLALIAQLAIILIFSEDVDGKI